MPTFIMILVAAAALAVLVGVVYVVLGKGGQLARFEADHPPLNLPEGRPVGSRDLSDLLIPLAMWGYHVRAVDALLIRLTATLREREERIEDLEWRLARMDPSYVPRGTGPQPGSYLPGDDEGTPAEAYAPEEGAEATSLTGNGVGAGTGADEPSPRGNDATVGGSGRDDQA
ncbi:hypothetical protein [Nocardiopsis oceani]